MFHNQVQHALIVEDAKVLDQHWILFSQHVQFIVKLRPFLLMKHVDALDGDGDFAHFVDTGANLTPIPFAQYLPILQICLRKLLVTQASTRINVPILVDLHITFVQNHPASSPIQKVKKSAVR